MQIKTFTVPIADSDVNVLKNNQNEKVKVMKDFKNTIKPIVWIGFITLFSFTSFHCSKPPIDSDGHYFEEFSKEETTAWIQKKLEKGLVDLNGNLVSSIRVEPCQIFYSYESGGLSGLRTMDAYDILTTDFKVNKEGTVMYTALIRSNCSTIDDNELPLRFVVPDIKIKKLGKNGHHRLTLAILHLNSFCTE